MVGLVQEPAFQRAMKNGRFARRIRNLKEPFYIVCGVGETGTLVCHGLDRLGLRFVVVDSDPSRIEQIKLGASTTTRPRWLRTHPNPSPLPRRACCRRTAAA